MTLGVDTVPLISDWNAEATHGFEIACEVNGMGEVSARSAFLLDDGIVKAAWMLGSALPDVDAIIAAASA